MRSRLRGIRYRQNRASAVLLRHRPVDRARICSIHRRSHSGRITQSNPKTHQIVALLLSVSQGQLGATAHKFRKITAVYRKDKGITSARIAYSSISILRQKYLSLRFCVKALGKLDLRPSEFSRSAALSLCNDGNTVFLYEQFVAVCNTIYLTVTVREQFFLLYAATILQMRVWGDCVILRDLSNSAKFWLNRTIGFADL